MTGMEELAAAAWTALTAGGETAAGTAAAGSAGTAAAGTAAAASGMTATQAAAYGLGSGIAGAAAGALLAPKPPGVKAPAAMPDQKAVDEARRRSLLEQMSRRGRASTILTDQQGDSLG